MENKRNSFFLSNKKQNEFKPGNVQNKAGKDKKPGFKPEAEKKEEFRQKRQDHFNKTRNGIEKKQEDEGKTKKPFDKKTYRLKKYSKKYKLEQYEEQRKKILLRNYYKEVKNDETSGSYKPKSFDEDTTDSNQVGRFVRHPDLIEKDKSIENKEPQQKNKKDPFLRAKEQYNKIKQDKLQKQQEMEKVKEEKRQKLHEYKKKKQDRFKKLSKKTKKGQPVMTGRLELLLEKIQKG